MENKNNKVQYESPVMKQYQLTMPKSCVLCASGEDPMSTSVSLQSMGEWE